MYQCCLRNSLRHMVKAPTRGPHLLDLVLTDLDTAVAATVLRFAFGSAQGILQIFHTALQPLVLMGVVSVWTRPGC